MTESYEQLIANVAAKRCVAIRNFYPFEGGDFIGDVSLPMEGSLGVDPILGRAVAELGLSEAIKQKLRSSGIELIGDLVQFHGQSILFDQLLDEQEERDLMEALANRGLTVGMIVPNWAEYLEQRKKKLG